MNKKDSKKEEVKVTSKNGAFSTIGFYPLKDIVILEPLNVKPLPSKSDIIIPESASEDTKATKYLFDKYPYQAIVVAIGPGFNKDSPSVLRPGDRVYMHGPMNATQDRMFIIDKKNYYKCQEGNILGLVEENIDDPRLDKESPIIKLGTSIQE